MAIVACATGDDAGAVAGMGVELAEGSVADMTTVACATGDDDVDVAGLVGMSLLHATNTGNKTRASIHNRRILHRGDSINRPITSPPFSSQRRIVPKGKESQYIIIPGRYRINRLVELSIRETVGHPGPFLGALTKMRGRSKLIKGMARADDFAAIFLLYKCLLDAFLNRLSHGEVTGLFSED